MQKEKAKKEKEEKIKKSKMQQEKIKLIIFDLWRTLAHRKRNYSSLDLMINHFKPKMSREKFRKIFEKSVQVKKNESKKEAYTNLAKNIGIEPNKKNVDWLIKRRDKDESIIELFPHTIPMLKKLKKQKIKTALLSNSTPFSVQHLKTKTKLLKHIDYPLFSFDYKNVKPSSKGFKILMKKAKSTPKHTIMIGDCLIDDIKSAKKVGLNTIRFKNYKQLKKQLEKFEISI